MNTDRDHLSADDAYLIVLIEKSAPDLLATHDLIDQFHAMIRKVNDALLVAWVKGKSADWNETRRTDLETLELLNMQRADGKHRLLNYGRQCVSLWCH